MTVIFEPAAAIAAAICIAARSLKSTTRHQRRCAWCDWPLDELRRLVDGYNAWAGYDERRGTYARHEARVFQALSRAEQARQVEAAQAFEPIEPSAPPAADAEPDPLPAWLTGGRGSKSSRPVEAEDRNGSQVSRKPRSNIAGSL